MNGKRILALILGALLAFGATGAMAATGDAVIVSRDTDGYNISTAAVVGEDIYLYTWNAILRYSLADGQMTEYARASEGAYLNHIFSARGQLYGLVEDWKEDETIEAKVYEIAMEGDTYTLTGEPIVLDWSKMSGQSRDGYMYTRSYENILVVDDFLYVLSIDDSYESTALMEFSLKDGACRVIFENSNIRGVLPYKDGQFLAVMGVGEHFWSAELALATFDLASGATTKVADMNIGSNNLLGIAYDIERDWLLYVTGGQIYRVEGLDMSTARIVNNMPILDSSTLTSLGRLLPGDRYLLYDYENVYIRNINPSQLPERTLKIKGYAEANAAYRAFSDAHPETSVIVDNTYSGSAGDDLINAMMARDSSVDVYLLGLSSREYGALSERGFLQELTDPAIVEEVGKLYPVVQEALTSNGKLVAVPYEIRSDSVFGYNKSVLEKLGLTEEQLPKTWSQMIELLARWGDEYQTDFPELSPLDPSYLAEIRRRLMNMILENYMKGMDAGEMRFDTPILRDTLKKLEEADFSAIEIEESEDGYSWDGDTVLFTDWAQVGLTDWGSSSYEVTWPLAFEEGADASVSMELNVMVINPFSENKDLAEEYLKYVMQNMKISMRTSLDPNQNEPYREVGYEVNRREAQRYFESLKKSRDSAAEEDKKMYDETIAEYEKYLAEYEDRWAASAEDIANYREMAKTLTINRYSPMQSGNEEIIALINRFSDGQMPVEGFVSAMDQKLRMMQMEGY